MPASPNDRRLRRLLPSLPEGLAVLLAVGLPIGFGFWWLSLDGDPGRHIRVGNTILQHGLFYTDRFSFTRPGAPFVPYEWLSEVLFALANRAAGLGGDVVAAGAVIGAAYGLMTRTMLRRGIGIPLASATVFFAFALGVGHWMARPHVFTLLGAAATMALLDRAQVGRSAWSVAWPTALVFAVWANLHGGFLYGLCLIVAVIVGERLEMLAAPGRVEWGEQLRLHAVMLATGAIAALANPVAVGIYAHTIGYLRDTYLLDHTQEYLSPDFHHARFALVALAGSIAALLALPRRPRYTTIAIVAMSLVFALDASRNLPFWGIVVLPVIVEELAQYVPRRWNRPGVARLSPVYPALAFAAMLAWASRGTSRLPATFNPSDFPVQAVRAARQAHLGGRLYSEFTWGGYILYAWPEERVFIDGQTDFYGDAIMEDYGAIHKLTHGWRDTLTKWDIGLAMVQTRSPLADALEREPGWSEIYEDSTATTFVRTSRQ